MKLQEQIIEIAKQVFDPEIPVNIWDLGLIYEIKADDAAQTADITMTLTSQACPAAQVIPDNLKQKIMKELKLKKCDIQIVYEPVWTPERISEEGKRKLGIEDA